MTNHMTVKKLNESKGKKDYSPNPYGGPRSIWSEEDPRSRISRLTRNETVWMNTLERSELDITKPFTATDGVRALTDTPTVSGSKRQTGGIPHRFKLIYVLKKSGLYEELPPLKGIRRGPKRFRLITRGVV